MNPTSPLLAENMARKNDEELVNILVKPVDWIPEALFAAKAEFKKRGLSLPPEPNPLPSEAEDNEALIRRHARHPKTSVTDCGEGEIFDSPDGLEFIIKGDGSRYELAIELSASTERMLEMGIRFARHFFPLPGEFCAEFVEVYASRTEGIDAAMRCSFSPADPAENFANVYLEFAFRCRTKNDDNQPLRCLRFSAGVW